MYLFSPSSTAAAADYGDHVAAFATIQIYPAAMSPFSQIHERNKQYIYIYPATMSLFSQIH